ncbi:MAG: hypothetical protein ACI9LG_000713 [Moritella dasanensis]
MGSDSGDYGFATPLATLHKFNGWSDQFLNTPTQGLADLYLSVSSKVAGGSAAGKVDTDKVWVWVSAKF